MTTWVSCHGAGGIKLHNISFIASPVEGGLDIKPQNPNELRGSVIFPIPCLPHGTLSIAAVAANVSTTAAYVNKTAIVSGSDQLWQRADLRKRGEYEIDIAYANAQVEKGGNGTAVIMEVVFDNIYGNIMVVSVGLKIRVALTSFKIESGTWNTSSVRPWNEPRHETEGRIEFTTNFSTAPTVTVGMTGADVHGETNFRVNVYATGIDSRGFTVHADSWSDTQLYACWVSWSAIGL